VNHEFRPLRLKDVADRLPVTDVNIEVPVIRKRASQILDHRQSRPRLAEELAPHVVVDPNDRPPFAREQTNAFRPD
jgi:hypothetical protein